MDRPTELEALGIVRGFQSGSIDHGDLIAMVVSYRAWRDESESQTAEMLREGFFN